MAFHSFDIKLFHFKIFSDGNILRKLKRQMLSFIFKKDFYKKQKDIYRKKSHITLT